MTRKIRVPDSFTDDQTRFLEQTIKMLDGKSCMGMIAVAVPEGIMEGANAEFSLVHVGGTIMEVAFAAECILAHLQVSTMTAVRENPNSPDMEILARMVGRFKKAREVLAIFPSTPEGPRLPFITPGGSKWGSA
jgi:hypothetical protein